MNQKIENGMMFTATPLPMTDWWLFWKAPMIPMLSFS